MLLFASPFPRPKFLCFLLIVITLFSSGLIAQTTDFDSKMQGFDSYMKKTLEDWNCPGAGVGIVVGDKLVFVKGYGYRDYGKKLPITENTLFQIASNSKLFTAVTAGMLVEQGKLAWDKPIRRDVPSIEFYNEELNNSVTLRDMLGHRTGVTRHDLIWYKSDFTRQELFEKLKYLEPKEPMRTAFLYNNLMYAAAGRIIELKSGLTWEDYVRQHVFSPLGMTSSVFTIEDAVQSPDVMVPYNEHRDSSELYRIPYYEDQQGIASAGAIISNIHDLSHWLIALMNEGKYDGKQVLPASTLKEVITPTFTFPNDAASLRGWWELLNSAYGMARESAVYRGHLVTFHGGDLPGIHSQVSYMPHDHYGVIVFVIGDHSAPLYNYISWNIYDRLLGLDEAPWIKRGLEIRLANKKAGTAARSKSGVDKVPGTHPSHPLADYVGEYEHPAYGTVSVAMEGDHLQLHFHKISLPLSHFHYDRFDTPDDEQDGQFSLNFTTNPSGDVDGFGVSLDEAAQTFQRKIAALGEDAAMRLTGKYTLPSKIDIEVLYTPGQGLILLTPGEKPEPLIRLKGLQFRLKEFPDEIFEFTEENGKIISLKQRDASGEFVFPRKQ